MIPKPLQIMPDFRPGGFKPRKISFPKFKSIFNREVKFCGFDSLTIRFDSDYKLLSARASRDGETGLPDLAFSFSRSQSVLNRIISIFRTQTPSVRVALPVHLLDSYSLVPKRSKLKGLRIMDFSVWVGGTVEEIKPLLNVKFGMYFLTTFVIVPSDDEDNALLWKLSLSHQIHDHKHHRIEIKSPVAKKWIELILPVLDAEAAHGGWIQLSCLERFTIKKGSKPKQSKSSEPPSDDDIPF